MEQHIHSGPPQGLQNVVKQDPGQGLAEQAGTNLMQPGAHYVFGGYLYL